MALLITSHLWGDKYGPEYVYRIKAGLARHLKQPHRYLVVTDRKLEGIETTPILDPELTKHKGCICRIRMFDPEWQKSIGLKEGDRLVNIDLDSVLTDSVDQLFDRDEPFVILQGSNVANPCPFNGSLFMLRAGYRPDVWTEFTLEKLAKTPFYQFPDDQGWFHHMIPGGAGWHVGPEWGCYVFHKKHWPGGDNLPKGARYITFAGWRDPSKFTHLGWVQRHWRT